MSIKNVIDKMESMGIISFSVDISQKEKDGIFKKDVKFPIWRDLKKSLFKQNYNGLAVKTGKDSGIFVLDIDNNNDWFKLLEDEEREEPKTVKAISGSGGLHYYFKYTEDLDELKTATKTIKDYAIDTRTNGGCVICPPSKYFNKNTNKECSYIWENSIFEHKLLEVPKWLKKLLFEKKQPKNKENKEIKIKNVKPSDLLMVELQKNKVKLTGEQIEKLIMIVDKKRADDYNTWVEMLFCLKCENNDDNFKYFDIFSKRSKKYDEYSVKNNWKKYDASKTLNKINYGSLLYWAKSDNPTEYNLFKKEYYKYLNIQEEEEIKIDDTLEIEQEYLLLNKKIGNCAVSKYINNFVNDNTKTLLIKSPYNTGKTTFLKSICDKYHRILFISYRITLSSNLYGNFKDYGFEKYTKNIHADKLICQVDSLNKIHDIIYDLIIIDESESVLNHFSAGSLKNNYTMFQLFCAICFNAKKLICLDGDLANRTKNIFKSFGECKFIDNKIQKDIKIFNFTPNQPEFNQEIDKKLKEGKKICIVSMSEQQANNYYKMYRKNHKTKIYTSKTSDSDKKKLEEVEKIWIETDILIYSPSIEAGVDFNIEHFDNLFIIMCGNSTSPRGLNQMIPRVRNFRDNNVLCFTHNLTYTENLNFYYYSFDEVKTFYNTLCDENVNFNYDGIHLIKENNNNKYYEMYDLLMMYNKQEQLNKNSNCFIPNFIKMIKGKGHKLATKNKDEPEKKRIIEKTENIVKGNILEAEKITHEQAEELKIKQAKQEMNENEKYQYTKYIYEDLFEIEFNNKETIDKYYNKMNIIKNCRNLIKPVTIKMNETEILNKEKIKKINTVKTIIELYKINIEELMKNKIIIDKKELETNNDKIGEILKNNKILFNLDKNFKPTNRKTHETVKNILLNYGIEITTMRDNKRKSGENKKNMLVVNFDEIILNKVTKFNNIINTNKMTDFDELV